MTPVKYVVLSEVAPTTYLAGSGNATFSITNMRAPCRFYLLTGGAQFPDVLAQSPELSMENVNTPTGVHIALPGKVSADKQQGATVRVSWVTLDARSPVVKYGDEVWVEVYKKKIVCVCACVCVCVYFCLFFLFQLL